MQEACGSEPRSEQEAGQVVLIGLAWAEAEGGRWAQRCERGEAGAGEMES